MVQFYFATISTTLWTIIGSIGNILSIIIFNSKEFNRDSTANYFIFASIMNIIAIFHLPLLMFPSIWLPTTISCMIMIGFKVLITQMHSWIVAFCSLDRVITVMAPQKFLIKNKLKFQIGIIIVVFIVIGVSFIPMVYPYQTAMSGKISDNQTRCSFLFQQEFNWAIFYYKIQYILFTAVLPFSIMITSSFLIVLTLWKSKNKVCCYNRNSSNIDFIRKIISHRREIQLAKSLVTMDFFFILFKLPMLIYLMIMSHEEGSREFYSFTYQLLLFISSTNIVCIFIIFFILNKLYRSLFRRYVKKLFGCKVITI
jgi:hypothetical protein